MDRSDIAGAIALFDEAREQLMEVAMSGNLYRPHHWDSAMVCFRSIDDLWKAQRIVESLSGLEEEEPSTPNLAIGPQPEDPNISAAPEYFKHGGT
jgi:hypothetical protein